ncbi:MAG: cupin domain-containing protein [Chitinophagales bacterium]
MNDFPEFMKNPRDAIASGDQSRGVRGYVYDGVGGGQMAYWTCEIDGVSAEHAHEFDEYFVVVNGEYVLIIEGNKITMRTGDEYYIPQGVPHAGEFVAGTRTIHAFGGKRAERA